MSSVIKATVTLEISVACHDTWGPDYTLDQVLKQAKESAVQALNAEAWEAKKLGRSGDRLTLIGTPKVIIRAVEI